MVCGVSENTAHTWYYGNKPIPALRARLLVEYIRRQVAQGIAAADELQAYIDQRNTVIAPGVRGKPFQPGSRSAARSAD